MSAEANSELPFDPTGVAERLAENSRRDGDCLVWTRSTRQGYGQIAIRKSPGLKKITTPPVHRVALMLARGYDLGDMKVIHKCNNRACFNLDHLLVGDDFDKMRVCIDKGNYRSFQAEKTHCIRGHEFTPDNTLIVKGGQGRQCVRCSRDYGREYARGRRTHCANGHPLTGGGARVRLTRRGTRQCLQCPSNLRSRWGHK